MEFEPMSPEEQDRMMQFLLSQQAQFAADFAMGQERIGRVESALVGLTGIVGRVADAQLEGARQIAELGREQALTAEQFRRTDERMARTDERLNALIVMFERHLGDGR